MSTGTVSVHSWNDSTFFAGQSNLSTEERAVGGVDGVWLDADDDGHPEMGRSYNAKLEPRPGFRNPRSSGGAGAGLLRGWGRTSGRGLRSNPVAPVRYGLDEEEGGGGW